MDTSVEAELKIRRRIENIFNKSRDEFESKLDYDDYLELREDYICNLVLRMDVGATEAKIAEYQRCNQANIAKNRAKKAGGAGTANAVAQVVASALLGEPITAQGAAGNAVTFTPSAQPGALPSAIPVPMTSEFSEDAEGTLRVPKKQVAPWLRVAAASGWQPDQALNRAFKSTAAFWLSP